MFLRFRNEKSDFILNTECMLRIERCRNCVEITMSDGTSHVFVSDDIQEKFNKIWELLRPKHEHPDTFDVE